MIKDAEDILIDAWAKLRAKLEEAAQELCMPVIRGDNYLCAVPPVCVRRALPATSSRRHGPDPLG